MADRQVRVAIVGLGFGAEFIPIYLKHASAEMYGICQRTEEKMNQVGDAFGIAQRAMVSRWSSVGIQLEVPHHGCHAAAEAPCRLP